MPKKSTKLINDNIKKATNTIDKNFKRVIEKVEDPKLWESTTLLFFIPLIVLIIIMIAYLIYREIHNKYKKDKK